MQWDNQDRQEQDAEATMRGLAVAMLLSIGVIVAIIVGAVKTILG